MIDLNADLGEGMDADDDLLGIVTSANIACGGHVGDRSSMARAAAGAVAAGVAIGAHPSYPDRDGFGRREWRISGDALADALITQISDLAGAARTEGGLVEYIKPHGALYHAVLAEPEHARALVAAAAEHALPLLLAPQAGAAIVGNLARAAGIEVYAEGFADRGYDADGLLLPRGRPGAVLTETGRAVAQALDLARGRVRTDAGGVLPLRVRSVCVHGDTPSAVALARAIRTGLERADVPLAPWSRP